MDVGRVDNSRQFSVRRMIREGNIISGVPSVVKCSWVPVRTENLEVYTAELEDAKTTTTISVQQDRKWKLFRSARNGTYLIPYGLAIASEIMSSDASMMNQGVITGDKSMSDMSSFCFGRIAKKRGILRKECNG